MGMPRDKTRPANPQSGTHREKTRPARQNSAVLAYFRSAGRKISRFLRRHSKQGEFSRADHHPLATLGTLTGTKLSGHTACKAATGTKLSPHTACKATTGTKLSQHSKNTQISPFEASREKIIPVETETTDAGRILSRRPPPTSHAGHTHRDKTLPARPHTGAHRYKTLPTQQKTPKSAQSTRARRKLSRSKRKQRTQGEFYPADHHPLATLGTLTGTKLSGHTAYKAATGTKLSPHCPMRTPPTKSHAIPSAPKPTTTQNVGIPMIEFQSWKYSSGNCMRNCRASRKTAHEAGPVVIHRPRLVCISCISANASDYQARTERS